MSSNHIEFPPDVIKADPKPTVTKNPNGSDHVQFPGDIVTPDGKYGGPAPQAPSSKPSPSETVQFPEDKVTPASPLDALAALGHWVGDLF